MLFVIHGFDTKDGPAKRSEHYPAHKAFLNEAAKFGVQIVISGPLVAEDGATPIGSHFVIEAPDRTAVEKFHHADPFFKAGVWDKPTVTAFIKRHG